MINKERHLNDDQIIVAVVDRNDLSPSQQNHLSTCSSCQKKKQALEQVLIRMGDLSHEWVPSPRRRFSLDLQKSPRFFRWQPVLLTGLAMVVFMLGIWWNPLLKRFQDHGPLHMVKTIESEHAFLADMTWADDHALPDRYLHIIGSSDDDDYDNSDDDNDSDDFYDDEFLEFILPL